MFRLGASLAVVLVVALAWFLFGNHGVEDAQSQQNQSTQPQPSADDDALRKSLGQ